jgi:hypothetical protein
LIRTRFLQAIFPVSKFIVILRHPLAVSYATMKWSKTSLRSLIDHSLCAYEIFQRDMSHLQSLYVLKYEDFVENPKEEMAKIFEFMSVPNHLFSQEILRDVNGKYFQMWNENRERETPEMKDSLTSFENRARAFGYSFESLNASIPNEICGYHLKS